MALTASTDMAWHDTRTVGDPREQRMLATSRPPRRVTSRPSLSRPPPITGSVAARLSYWPPVTPNLLALAADDVTVLTPGRQPRICLAAADPRTAAASLRHGANASP